MSTALQPRFGPATLVPFGLGSTHPIAWGTVARAVWENRGAAGHALGVLQTPCTHCSTSGFHLCEPRLQALADQHRAPLVPFDVRDAGRLKASTPAELRALGRIRTPLRRTRQGFETVSWDDALRIAGPRGRAIWAPAVRGLSDEVYAAIAAAAEQVALAPTGPVPHAVSTEELDEAERIVIWGVPVHQWAPDLLRSLARARRRGARVIAVGTREPAMEAHRFPNTWRAAWFGEVAVDSWVASPDPAAVIQALAEPSRDLRAASGLARVHLERLVDDLQVQRVVGIVPTVDPNLVRLHQERGWTGVGAGLMRVGQGHGLDGATNAGLSGGPVAEADWCAVFGDTAPVPSARRVFVDTHLRPAMLEKADEVVILPMQPVSDQRGGAWISADCRVFSARSAGRFGGTRARAAWSLPSQLVAAADPARAGEVPTSIEDVRNRLRELPAYANAGSLEPGGWARVPRA